MSRLKVKDLNVDVLRTTEIMLRKYRQKTSNLYSRVKINAEQELSKLTPDEFINQEVNLKCDREMVTVLFLEIMRKQPFLDSFLDHFHRAKSTLVPREPKDQPILYVLLYLAIFVLTEDTKEEICHMLLDLELKKTIYFFKFLKNENTTNIIYECCVQFFDLEYINTIMKKLASRDVFTELCFVMEQHLEYLKQPYAKLTIPLDIKNRKSVQNVPSACSSKLGEKLPPTGKEKKSSRYIRSAPKEGSKLKEAKLEGKEEKPLKQEQKSSTRCCTSSQRGLKQQHSIRKIESDKVITVQPPKPIKKPSRTLSYSPACKPKHTAATIMREGARILKEEEEVVKKYDDLACGGFNTDILEQWEADLREQRIQQHLQQIKLKHIQGMLTMEEAQLAKETYLTKKKIAADALKTEKEKWLQDLEDWKMEEERRIRENVHRVREISERGRYAKEEAMNVKRRNAKELHQELLFMKREVMLEKEKELEKKLNLIKEVKALQTISQIRKKQTEVPEGGNIGLLCEMSMPELKERLLMLKMELSEALETKKQELKRRRECRLTLIDSFQDLIDTHHQLKAESSNKSRQVGLADVLSSATVQDTEEIETIKRRLDEIRRLKKVESKNEVPVEVVPVP